MMIVCANSKGGVGKSTIAAHLAVWLYDQGFKTALLDADKQRSSSVWIAEAEPNITVRTASKPEECLAVAQELHQSHDFLIGDAPGGLEDLSRTLLILADVAVFPISPSVLDLRSVAEATEVLRYAQMLREGQPEGILILNKMKSRGRTSKQLVEEAPKLGLRVAQNFIRLLEAYIDAPQQGTVASRLGRAGKDAAAEIEKLFKELFGEIVAKTHEARRDPVGNE